jgi:hypothetical protein
MEIRDDQARNCLTLVLNYEIRDGWKQANDGKRLSFCIIDAAITGSELNALRGTPRQVEIYLGRPRKFTRFLHMDMPRAWAGTGWLHESEAPGIKFFSRLRIHGRTISNSKELLITKWSLPAAEASAYSQVVKSLHENLLNIYASERFGKLRPMTVGRVSIGARLAAAMGSGFRIVWLIMVGLWIIGHLLAKR